MTDNPASEAKIARVELVTFKAISDSNARYTRLEVGRSFTQDNAVLIDWFATYYDKKGFTTLETYLKLAGYEIIDWNLLVRYSADDAPKPYYRIWVR